jgi:hypothetical protein
LILGTCRRIDSKLYFLSESKRVLDVKGVNDFGSAQFLKTLDDEVEGAIEQEHKAVISCLSPPVNCGAAMGRVSKEVICR